MNQPSIFKRLSSYKPAKARTPEEDFFSEAFVGVLERDDELAKTVFKFLHGGKDTHGEEFTIADVPRIRTQKICWTPEGRERRIDIEMTATGSDGGNHIIFVESKLGSGEGDMQLDDYSLILQEKVKQRGGVKECRGTLCYITKFPDPKDGSDFPKNGVGFNQKRWSDIYEKMGTNDGSGSVWAKELLLFMEEKNMDSNEPKLRDFVAGRLFLEDAAYSRISASMIEVRGAIETFLSGTGKVEGHTNSRPKIWSSDTEGVIYHNFTIRPKSKGQPNFDLYWGIWYLGEARSDGASEFMESSYDKLPSPGDYVFLYIKVEDDGYEGDALHVAKPSEDWCFTKEFEDHWTGFKTKSLHELCSSPKGFTSQFSDWLLRAGGTTEAALGEAMVIWKEFCSK